MAWFYSGKQVYGAWTDVHGTQHPADWDEVWTDEQKVAAGLTTKGDINLRFWDGNGTPRTVDEIKALEKARMDGLHTYILGLTCSDVISEVDGTPLADEQIEAEIRAQRAGAIASHIKAKQLIDAETTFDGLYNLIMNSGKTVEGVYVPADSGDWGIGVEDEQLHDQPPFGIA